METDSAAPPAGPATGLAGRSAPILELAPLALVEIKGAMHVVSYANAAFCALLGKSSGELIGASFAEIAPGGKDCVPILDRIYATGKAVSHAHEIAAAPDAVHWLYVMWPVLGADDRPTRMIIELTKTTAFHHDAVAINEALLISGLRQHELTTDAVAINTRLAQEITERTLVEAALQTANRRLADQAADLERVVAERTEKLRETVEELEGFSYSVAHDMRSPLRGMQGFAQILLQEHTHRLDTAARGYLQSIASSAARLDLLIQDVLNYKRVLSGAVQLTAVNLDRLVRDIVGIYPNWQPPHAKIQIEGILPAVFGHEGFLTQCVSNLVSNAVKFMAPGIMPRVRIWAEERAYSSTQAAWPPENGKVAEAWKSDGPVVRVWFENNGIGIAATDRGRVFRMFDRINPTEQFAGTGIGLTIVRKAVQRMGGRIDFESEPGQGSKFWIELKKAPAAMKTTSDAI